MDPNNLFETLRLEILDHSLQPGSVLKQEALAARFGVSRQPVRLALNRLLETGLAIRRSDRSLAVAIPTKEALRDLSEIRTILECEALRQSLPRLTSRGLHRARRIAEDIVEETDPAEIEDLDASFHATLYGACGNERLLQLIDELRREGRWVYGAQPAGSGARSKFAAQHYALLDACEAGDVNAACAALADHLRAIGMGDEP